jgi:hypothetical protein
MAHFFGKLQGARGEATRLGHKSTGLDVTAASWEGAVHTRLHHGQDGHDYAVVELIPWNGSGVTRELYRGRVDGT